MRLFKRRRVEDRRTVDVALFQQYAREIQAAETPEEVHAVWQQYEAAGALLDGSGVSS